MSRKKTKEYTDDDGRTVANMNVEGMPWYVERRPTSDVQPEKLTARQTWSMIGGVLSAALLVAAAFGLVYFLFICFCDFVWLR